MNEQDARRAERDLTACTALVIDSDATARSLLVNQLKEFGVGQVAHFGRVREARKYLETRGVDFVLCEQSFKDEAHYSGSALLDDLRRAQLLPYSSVFIMVTAEATYAKVAEAAESSLDAYLLKPHKPSMLYACLMQARRRKIRLKPVFDLIDAQDFEQAATVCESFFRNKVAHPQFVARMGAELMLRLGRYDDAKGLFQAVIEDQPVMWAKLGVARAQLEAGARKDAMATLDDLISEDGQFVEAYDVLGRALMESGNYAKAFESFARAAELTPGSVSRVQKHGTLAFYMGEFDTAHKVLLRCSVLGAGSKMFDYQSLVLLAFCAVYAKDRRLLVRCQEDLARVRSHQPDSERLRRFDVTVNVLVLVANGKINDAVELLGARAAELRQPDFDFETACNLSLLIASSAANGLSLPHGRDWIRGVGLRYCRTKAMVDQLNNTLRRQPELLDVIKACNAEVIQLANDSMSVGLAGNHRGAVERLFMHGQSTLNAKLIENAHRVLKLHGPTMGEVEGLEQQVAALRAAYGLAQSSDSIGRDSVRLPSLTVVKAIAQSALDNDAEDGVPGP